MNVVEELLVTTRERLKKVENILVSQPKPSHENSPYVKLADQYNLQIDFKKFIEICPIGLNEFRKQNISILAHTAVILTSRNSVDHFFDIARKSKVNMPKDMKYFCVSEQTANYLQKYIVVRKRKIFVGERTAKDLITSFKKHTKENYLFPCSNIRSSSIPNFLNKNDYQWSEAIMYNTVPADLTSIKNLRYDIIAFFSPSGVESLFTNFPDFEQGSTRIAALGPSTANAVRKAGLILDIQAPLPNAPSMTGALEVYIRKANNI